MTVPDDPADSTAENAAVDLLFGAKDIAEFLGRSRDQIYYAIRNGTLPHFKLGGKICARRSTLIRWIERYEDGLHRPRR